MVTADDPPFPLPDDADSVTVTPDGARLVDRPLRAALLSGSFNPLHAGHQRLLAVAARCTGLPGVFELPVVNADKGTLPAAEIERRLAQFRGRDTVILTRWPLFTQKARHFAGSAFVIGVDTARRLVAPRYYGDEAAMHAALSGIRGADCRFVVAGRLEDGRFRTLSDVAVPPGLADLFEGLPEDAFRADVSSTALRDERR